MSFFSKILQQASSYGSKSSILSALIWVLLTFITALLFLVLKLGTNNWVAIGIFVIIFLIVILIIAVYIYCLYKGNTDSLRSEKFVIQKMVIENQIKGDSLTGFYEESTINKIGSITSGDEVTSGDEEE